MGMFIILGVSNGLNIMISCLWVLHLLTLLWFLELHLWDVVLKSSTTINYFISVCITFSIVCGNKHEH